ncbi:MAG TPA: NarK/NasA family nitrate transporter [Campylobacterales bacterium]|nr:NarK/NasA family nitrate transporter [Campylobacterales bacterium]HIO70918.1 NarK/NasA family nitrate transporter [Campylobacterales bacterium]
MMAFSELKGKGHWPTLFASFLYFDFSFMVWLMLGPLAQEITADIPGGLTDGQIGTMVAVPIFAGAVLRIVLGFGVDKFGPKITALFAQTLVVGGLFYGYLFGFQSYEALLVMGAILGLAGASFAVALPQAGQWYPPHLQGVVLGIAGAGNIGVVIDFLFAPKIAELWGWQAVFGVGGFLSLIILIIYAVVAKDAPPEVYTPRPKKLSDYGRLLKDKDTWWFSLFYAISFGGFVGFAGYMKVYLINEYQSEMALFGSQFLNEENVKVVAGYFGAITIFAGAVLRPVGGYVADRIGGVKSLYLFYGAVATLAFINGMFVTDFYLAISIIFLTMASLGMANGAVFQLVPQRFGKDIGIMTGIIGASGGFGGSLLATMLGYVKGATGSYSIGFISFAGVVLIAIFGISMVKTRWRTTWGVQAGGKI